MPLNYELLTVTDRLAINVLRAIGMSEDGRTTGIDSPGD